MKHLRTRHEVLSFTFSTEFDVRFLIFIVFDACVGLSFSLFYRDKIILLVCVRKRWLKIIIGGTSQLDLDLMLNLVLLLVRWLKDRRREDMECRELAATLGTRANFLSSKLAPGTKLIVCCGFPTCQMSKA